VSAAGPAIAPLLPLIEASDLDGLIVAVDRLCADEAWDSLVSLRDACRAALERGRQLWPVASHIEYRLALSAPGRWAAGVLRPGAGRFAPGPLPEVAASAHCWNELAPWVLEDAGPLAAITAHERVVRGEDLSASGTDGTVLELPLRLQPWEPAYPVATYHPDRGEFPFPSLPEPTDEVRPPRHADVTPADDPESVRALLDVASVWTAESDGRAEAVAVEGDAVAALGRLGVVRARVVSLTVADALAALAWAAASGGAHGRRRGMAAGRFGAWWTAAALTGLLGAWPPPSDELGEALRSLRWYRWDAGDPDTGWVCRVAAEDPSDGVAWALAATDAA
jgi:hypothetical protein